MARPFPRIPCRRSATRIACRGRPEQSIPPTGLATPDIGDSLHRADFLHHVFAKLFLVQVPPWQEKRNRARDRNQHQPGAPPAKQAPQPNHHETTEEDELGQTARDRMRGENHGYRTRRDSRHVEKAFPHSPTMPRMGKFRPVPCGGSRKIHETLTRHSVGPGSGSARQ